MCGLIAISCGSNVAFQLEKALNCISHRGPDDRGTFVSELRDCYLGHVRLSILDLSAAGHQPMEDSSGRYIISYNGEIYNYPELKELLTKKYPRLHWKSTSDTEVIIEGFAREGVQFLEQLNGIFAIAIFDKWERVLTVLRDPLGIKPLFFTQQKGGFFFGSELKGLLAFSELKRTIRLQSLAEQLAFMYVPEPFTLFEEFLKLEPGLCLSYREGQLVSSLRLFNQMQTPISFSSEKETISCFYQSFSSAVRRQLISDAPLSLMLSGGLDSSAVAFEAVRLGANISHAYTIAFRQEDMAHDQQSDDLQYAKLMASQLGLKLEILEADPNLMTLIPTLSPFLEDGISDPAAINTYLICRLAAKNGIKVMLTGQGADEYLGGYRRYGVERILSRTPWIFRMGLAMMGKCVLPNIPKQFNAIIRRINRLASLASQSQKDRLLAMYTWGDMGKISQLIKDDKTIFIGRDFYKLFERYRGLDIVEAMMKMDHHYDLRSLNLTYTDRMSMAVGVEARVPFLDFELVKMMNSIPVALKIKKGSTKYILKKAMESHLPQEIIYREKAGFALPIRAWINRDNEMLKYFFDGDRIRRQNIFEPDLFRHMCDEQFNGKKDYANVLFSMLCIQVFLDTYQAVN